MDDHIRQRLETSVDDAVYVAKELEERHDISISDQQIFSMAIRLYNQRMFHLRMRMMQSNAPTDSGGMYR